MQVELSSERHPGVMKVRRDGKRVYDKGYKASVVAECHAGEQSIAQIALNHRINANLVRKWITQAQAKAAPTMIPVRVNESRSSSSPNQTVMNSGIEIDLASGKIRVSGQPDERTLRIILETLSARR